MVLGRDDQTVGEISDHEFVRAFRAYHAAVGRLDFVTRHTNLSQAGKHRLKPARMKVRGPVT